MRKRRTAVRKVIVAIGTLVVLALGTAVAQASPPMQGSGAGQSHESAAFGFNVDTDLNGQFEYNADPAGPDAGFRAHCSGYNWVTAWTSWDGFPSMRFRSLNCTDQDGVEVHLRSKIIDRGEPGVNDYAHILFCYAGQWRDSDGACYLHGVSAIDDNGIIENGNIQILHYVA